MSKNTNDPIFYDFFEDERKYPDAVVYVVMSQRGVGKTYGFLNGLYDKSIRGIYMKRTIDDVLTICSGDDLADINPYKPINVDHGHKIKPKLLNKKGIGYFADYNILDEDKNPKFASYICALNALKIIRGMDLQDADYMVLDEFVPTEGDLSVRHKEGEQLLSCYMSFNRRREDKGKKPLKMVLFSNCDDIMCPIVDTLEIGDMIADMVARGDSHYYDEDRKILIHHITEDEIPPSEATKQGMWSVMKGTAWHSASFGGSFANNDFTNVQTQVIRHSRCIMKVHYKNKDIYCYENADSGKLYFCYTPHKTRCVYDFDKEADRLRYLHYDNAMVRGAIMNDEAKFQKFTMYDLFMNFTKKFRM